MTLAREMAWIIAQSDINLDDETAVIKTLLAAKYSIQEIADHDEEATRIAKGYRVLRVAA